MERLEAGVGIYIRIKRKRRIINQGKMKKTPVKLPINSFNISYKDNCCFLGSCFSEHLSFRLKDGGFHVHANPFGVIFNPISLTSLINNDIESAFYSDSILQQKDVFLSWEANSTVFAYSEQDLFDILIKKVTAFQKHLAKSKVLFVTFGTAWIYEHEVYRKVVANCHKVPNQQFKKRLLSIEEIVKVWENTLNLIQGKFPSLNVVFTVSPVRHIKEGLIENNRSKAVLIEATHRLTDMFPRVYYFPAYELMIDELRDYAFYEKDGIHPNAIAVDHIWNVFQNTFFDRNTKIIYDEREELKKQLMHKPLHEKSKETLHFKQQLEKKLEAFKKKHPTITF